MPPRLQDDAEIIPERPSERLSQLATNDLSWQERSRTGILNYFRVNSIEELKTELGDRMPPEGIGDFFRYRLKGLDGLDLNYDQTLYPTHPFGNLQTIGVDFKRRGKQPSKRLPHEAWGFPTANMKFTMGEYEDKRKVTLQVEKFLNLHKEAQRFAGKNEFTEEGRKVIETLLSVRQRLVETTGLKPEDQEALRMMLSCLKTEFQRGNLTPDNWVY